MIIFRDLTEKFFEKLDIYQFWHGFSKKSENLSGQLAGHWPASLFNWPATGRPGFSNFFEKSLPKIFSKLDIDMKLFVRCSVDVQASLANQVPPTHPFS